MSSVSVIIPAYNQAEFIPEAIDSVLGQSQQDWELIVVDDGSTDATATAVQAYADPRIRYVYQENRGLPGARNSGIRHATGEYLAFLDADDYYHPEKLATQGRHLDQNPRIGLSYASRISVDEKGNPLRLRRPPPSVSLASFIEGFPFTINDLLIRRRWIERIGGFDESFFLHSEDRDFYIRLLLASCPMARTCGVVAYRRVHPDRVVRDIPERLRVMFRALDTLFEDPRCPPEIMALRDRAYARDYLVWGYQAAAQGDAEVAQEYLGEAVRLNPALRADGAQAFLHFVTHAAIADGAEHQLALERVFAHLPQNLSVPETKYQWAIGYGYLMRGTREVMWDRVHAKQLLRQGTAFDVRPDDYYVAYWTEQLLNSEAEFGVAMAEEACRRIAAALQECSMSRAARLLKARTALNRAFLHHRHGKYEVVPRTVLRALMKNPRYLFNRGVFAIFFRSLWRGNPFRSWSGKV